VAELRKLKAATLLHGVRGAPADVAAAADRAKRRKEIQILSAHKTCPAVF